MSELTEIRNDENVTVRIEDLANEDISDDRRVAGQGYPLHQPRLAS